MECVCRLCKPDKKLVVKNWILSMKKRVDILDLQEVKADKFRLDIALRSISPSYQYYQVAPEGGRGGKVLLVAPWI